MQSLLSSSLLPKIIEIKTHRTVILPVILCGCETVILREELGLRVFGNVAVMIFGDKRIEVTGEWRRLHNEELCALVSSPNIIRVIKSRRAG